MEKIGIFFDTESVYHDFYKAFKGRVDYKKLLNCISQGRNVELCNAYAITGPDGYSFTNRLSSAGISVKQRVVTNSRSKFSWHCEMSFDIVDALRDIDTVCIVSGNMIYSRVVKYAISNKKNVEIWIIPESSSRWFSGGEGLVSYRAIGPHVGF